MDWLVFAAQWTHVLLGIFWFGNALVAGIIIIPAISPMPIPLQRDFGGAYGARAAKVFNIVGPLVIILGAFRGTFLGPIKGFDTLATPYGITWATALVVATLTLLYGMRVIEPSIHAMNAAPLNADGSATPELEAAAAKVKQAAGLELALFFVIFTCMTLMRFGL